MTCKKFIMLAILLVGLLTLSAVSAADNITSEKESNEVVSIEENGEILQENVLGASPGTYTELANEIAKSKTELNLNKDYAYTAGDSAYGIIIHKSIKINGNGHTINGNGKSRPFYIDSSDVVIKNINFMNACGPTASGGFINWNGDNGVLTNCNFIDSFAYDGGAVSWYGNNGVLSDCSFVDCYSTHSGGAVKWGSYISEHSDSGVLANCSFVNCHVHEYAGGAVSWYDKNGQVIQSSFINCSAGEYGGGIYFSGKNCSLINPTFENNTAKEGADWYSIEPLIIIKDTKLTAEYDANTKNIIATVKDTKGNPVSGLKVGFAINGVKYVVSDANGQAKYSTAYLTDNTYKVTVRAYGNETYKDSNKETVTFTIGSKEMSKIFLRNALYFVTQTKLVQVTLWDGNNQPLAGKTVSIRAYDSVWHGVTDENGDAFVRVGIGFGVHDATVSFDGDDQYFGSEKAGYIRVIKQTPSVMVRGADTMFKATNPVKIVKVHLRDRYDQPLQEGSKIVLKLNGKTYIGFTDAEGVARIAININTVGTFTAQAMYGGNTAYNPVTRDVKIRIV